MGVTGSGKSTFISLLAQEEVRVGHSLESCTTEVEIFSFFNGGRVGYLIDTPGFDDTTRSDTDILKEIVDVLNRLYTTRICLTGLIYLHRITDVRMQGSAVKNLDMLRSLCGEDAFPNIALVSTMWQTLDDQRVGIEREAMLKSNERFWGGIWRDDNQVKRHSGDVKSAREIVSWLAHRESKVVLGVQRQMIDEGLMLGETTAGKYLRRDLNKLRERYEKEMEELKESLKEARQDNDTVTEELLLAQRKEFESKLSTAVADEQGLRVSSQDLQTEKSLELERKVRELEQENSASHATVVAQAIELQKTRENHLQLEEQLHQKEKEFRKRIEAIERQREDSRKLQLAWTRERGERQLGLESSRRRQEEKSMALRRERGRAGYFRAEFWRTLVPEAMEWMVRSIPPSPGISRSGTWDLRNPR
jgi:myosin heavy subunit